MKGAWFAVMFAAFSITAEAGPMPSIPVPPPLSPSQYDWQQTGITSYGLQADGLMLYGFDFTFTNIGTTPLINVYDIIPPDPSVSFGFSTGVWDSNLRAWTAMTTSGQVEALPYNIVGFANENTLQFPVFDVAPYLAAGHSRNVELQFEISPAVGYFTFDGYLTAVPEPASIALLIMGLAGLGWAVRRRAWA